MNHILTIIDKEWAEVFKNKMVLFTMIFLPLTFTALPLVMLFITNQAMGDITSTSMADVPVEFLAVCGSNMTGGECMQIYIINQFLLLFMMVPVIIPVTIAAYSIVGEKTTHSLEPLLATPLTTTELLAGKCLAAGLPAIIVGWISFGLFLLGLPILGVSRAVISYIISPTWLLAILIGGPLMAVASVNFAIYISSRVSDPRVAEQISALLIVPILGLMFAQIAGVIVVNVIVMLSFIGGMILFDIGMIYLGATIFQRETILTRWK
ncbi:MAG: ABC transporter permease subunit [Chloroflexota bacterium]|nr:ABC transporter permease subunit [Chloroflexota bacterium]